MPCSREGLPGPEVDIVVPLHPLWRQTAGEIITKRLKLQPPDALHDQERAILHCRMVDGLEVPHAPGQHDLDEGCDEVHLAVRRLFIVGQPQRSEHQRILQGEAVLGVEENRGEPIGIVVGGVLGFGVGSCVEPETFGDKRSEIGAGDEVDPVAVLTYPAVEFGALPVEVLRLCACLSFPDFVGILAAEPKP